MVLISNAQSIKLFEAHYGKAPWEAYGWGKEEVGRSEAGRAVLKEVEDTGVIPYMLAWEYIVPPDCEVTLVNAETVSNSFFGASFKSAIHLVGDPFRSPRPGAMSNLLMNAAENEVSLPFTIVRNLRELGFHPDQWLPIDEDIIQVVDAIEEDARMITVVVPTWADMELIDWATPNRFPKDDFGVFATTVADIARHGPNRAYGLILEACQTKFTRERYLRRGTPEKTAEELAKCDYVSDFAKDTVPMDVLEKDLNAVWSPTGLNYPRGSDRRIMTVYTLNDTDWVVLLPPPAWWKDHERAWYLYRAATSAREGILVVDEEEEGF